MTRQGEMIVDSFAGGGGASTGIEQALGVPVDVAINHDAQALAMHTVNHPETLHLRESVWRVDPRQVCRDSSIALAWFSPDCTHFSKAKGGRPVKKNIRGLAWVALKWAGLKRPRVIILENVEEFQRWGPLTRSGKPCKRRAGMTFQQFVGQLRDLGYAVEWRELRACDYGAPTIRKRLFLIARCDGAPIAWPAPTHGPAADLMGLLPYRTAAECIDWSIPCPSIFERKRPLAEATLRRIARGVQRYVIEAAEPFIIRYQGRSDAEPIDEPLSTVLGMNKHGFVVPTLIQTGYGERPGQQPRLPGLEKPLGTAVAGGVKHALVAAFLAQHNTGMVGHDARKPVSTITGRATQQQIVCAMLSHNYTSNTNGGQGDPRLPHKTVTTGGHHALVKAFLLKYYGTAVGQSLPEPMHSATAKARFGLVTISGQDYRIVDIGMRMLTPRELFRAQGFPDSYVIDPVFEGKPLTKTAQIRMCGNSVCPPVARAVVAANLARPISVDVAGEATA